MTTQELKALWYNDVDMTMEQFIEVVRADERIKTVQFIADEFNRSTVCIGRATAKTFVINTLNEIILKLKETPHE